MRSIEVEPLIRVLSRFKTLATLLGLRMSGALAAFTLTLILARTMGQDDMGRAMALMSFAILLGVAVSGGMEAGAVHFIARYREVGDMARARGFLGLTRWVALALGMVCAITAGWLLLTAGAPAFAMALLAAAVLGLLRVGAAHALAFGNVVASLAPTTFLRQLFLLVGIAAIALTTDRLSVSAALAVFLAANSAALAAQIVMNHSIVTKIGSGPSDRSTWREWAIYGFHMAPALLFVQYSRDLVLTISAWTLAPTDIAVLGVVTALTAFAKFAVAAINQSITPTMAKLIASADHDGLADLIRTSNHMKFWMVLVGTALAVPLGTPVLGIFGEAFRESTSILLILMVEPLVLAFFGPAGQYLSLAGHQRVMIPMALFALAALITGIIAGAWLAGLEGAVIGVAASWMVWMGTLALRVKRLSGIDVTMIGTLRTMIRTARP